MTLFNIARAYQLTGQQAIKDAAQVRAQVVLEKLRVKFRVVGNLDWPRCLEQSLQRLQRLVIRKSSVAAIGEGVEVDDADTVGSCELNQTQTPGVRIKLCSFGIKPDRRLVG